MPRWSRASLSAVLPAAAAALLFAADEPYAPDVPETGSVEAIARFTSEPRFLSPWVAYVPASSRVPSPSQYLGHVVGAAGELTRSERIHGYLRALAGTTPRVHVETIGKTEEGREILLVAVADEEGIAGLERLKAAAADLADPRRTTPEQAERIIASTARPFYYFNAALHADETGSAEMVMELAHRLAVSEQPMIRRIRERVVVLINPVSNPDGRDKMVDWFYRHLKGKTDYAALPRQSPPYWGRYVFVDANRDAHQQSQELTRAVHRMFHAFHPVVVHDLHEGLPLLQTWNGTGPYNPNLDPIVTSAFLEMSFHEVTTLTAMGMPGVWTWRFGEGFGHHYLDSIAMNHNAIGRGYETFGNATAETVERTVGPGALTREWYRPAPLDRATFRWSLRDHVNYAETACLSILDYTARNAAEMLRNFYRTGYNSWRKGLEGRPRAFVIREDQGDRLRVARMINLLRAQRIEVSRASHDLVLGEGRFPSGSFVVRLDQPYRNYAVDLLAPQAFPADSPHQPYDDVSWALPVHHGLEAVAVDDARIAEAALSPMSDDAQPEGRVRGSGPVHLLADTGQEALLAARYRLARFRVEIAERPFRVGSAEYPAGSWILPAQAGLGAALRDVARELALDFDSAPEVPDVPRHAAPAPRLGVWVPWADTDSIGWIRYTLDRQGVPYAYVRDEDIRAGGLRDTLDVLLYGNVDLDLAAQIHGIPSSWGPLAFTRTSRFPSHGVPAASDDITGGIGWAGLAHLQRFVEEGGVLITMGNGSTLALEGGLVRFVQRASIDSLSTPGVELKARFSRSDHPIAYGYGPSTSVFRSNYPVYDTPVRWSEMSYCTSCLEGPADRRAVILEWGTTPDDRAGLVVSGGARNEKALQGRPAILDVPLGRGRIVVFNFNPLHRDLNYSDHRLLWNAILNAEVAPPR